MYWIQILYESESKNEFESYTSILLVDKNSNEIIIEFRKKKFKNDYLDISKTEKYVFAQTIINFLTNRIRVLG